MTHLLGQTHDELREVFRQIFSAPEYQWDRPRSLFDVIGDWMDRVTEFFQRLHESHPFGYYVVVAMLSAVLVVVLIHFAYIIWRVLVPPPVSQTSGSGKAAVPRGSGWYLQQSQRLVENGRYAEALAHRFQAMLLTLDRHRAVSFHPSKTPAEYLDELRLDEDGRGTFARLVRVLYRHLFGGAPCTEADVQNFNEVAALLEGHAPAS